MGDPVEKCPTGGKRYLPFDTSHSPPGAQFSHRYIETILVNLPKVSAFDIIECTTLGKRLALFDPQLQLTCYRSSEEELGFTMGLSG